MGGVAVVLGKGRALGRTYSAEDEGDEVCCSVWEHEHNVCEGGEAEYGHEGVSGCEGGVVGVEFDPGVRAVDAWMESEVHFDIERELSVRQDNG